MSVSSIETLTGEMPAAGSGSPTITTSLVSTDRVVVTVSKAATSGTPSVSGLGATWNTDVSVTSTYDLYIFSASGITGGGTLTITPGGAVVSNYIVEVLRSSVPTAPYLVGASGGNSNTVSPPAVLSAASTTAAAANSIVVSAARISAGGGTISFPVSSTPSSGWTTSYNPSAVLKAVRQTLTADATVSMSVTGESAFGGTIAYAVYYDDDVSGGPSPLTDTFVGVGRIF